MALTQVQGGMILPSTTLTTPIVATTMGVGGATPATTGSGITFPATQSSSSDANTLDDYEEGTWTPTLGGNSVPGTVTYSERIGRYTKIGRNVFVSFTLTTSSTISGATGVLLVYGLPFAAIGSVSVGGGGGSIGYTNGLASGIYTSSLYTDALNTYVVPVYNANSGGVTFWTVSLFQNGSTISGGFTYQTA